MEKMNFEEEYGSLPANKQAEARTAITKACEWSSRTTFYNKMKGDSGVRNWEKQKIKEVFSKYGIVLFDEK